eukprot:jgi/Mesvir1/22489/Mv04296-RA.1
MTSMYPMYSSNATPTVRSAQAQQRINDFASKIFTPYELQKLRTYIPGIKFVVEEAGLYKQNIVEKDTGPNSLLPKLQGFVASVYIYDILGSLMRDINERVRRATDSSLLEVDRAEMAKLVNALRGFVACEVNPISLRDDAKALSDAQAKWDADLAKYIAENTGGLGAKHADDAAAKTAFEDPAVKGARPSGRLPRTDLTIGSRARAANEKVYMHRIPPDTMVKITKLYDMTPGGTLLCRSH